MRRLIAVLLTGLLTSAALVAATAAPAQANHNCNTYTVTPDNWHVALMTSTLLKVHFTPPLYVSNAENHCERVIAVVSHGWRFRRTSVCGTFFAIRIDVSPDRMLGTPTTVCAGQAKRLYCCSLPRSAVVQVYGSRNPWHPDDFWLGTVRH